MGRRSFLKKAPKPSHLKAAVASINEKGQGTSMKPAQHVFPREALLFTHGFLGPPYHMIVYMVPQCCS
jgi:hypothetical protein